MMLRSSLRGNCTPARGNSQINLLDKNRRLCENRCQPASARASGDGFCHAAVELLDYRGQEETMNSKHPTFSSTEPWVVDHVPGQKIPWAPPTVTIISGVKSTGAGFISGSEGFITNIHTPNSDTTVQAFGS